MSKERFNELYPAFVSKFVPDEIKDFSWQKYIFDSDSKLKFGFYPTRTAPTKTDWEYHFLSGNEEPARGSIGIVGSWGNKTKWICFDWDSQEFFDMGTQLLLPYFQSHGIEVIIAHSRPGHAHCWIMVEPCDIKIAEDWIRTVLKETGTFFPEIYPLFNKSGNVIRADGGRHIKSSGTRFGGEYINHLGASTILTQSLDIMEAYIKCRTVSIEQMKNLTSPECIAKVEKPVAANKEYLYISRDNPLPLPAEEMPEDLHTLCKQCPAVNWVLKSIREKRLLNDKTGIGHMAGFNLTGVAMFLDAVNKCKTKFGRKFISDLVTHYRFGDVDSHNWDYYFDRYKDSPLRFFPKCSDWEVFGQCDSCEHKGSIGTPRRFVAGSKPIQRSVISSRTLKSLNEIRTTSLQSLKDRINHLLNTGEKENMGIFFAPGIGKSTSLYDVIEENPDKNFLLLTPFGELARDAKKYLVSRGVDGAHALVGFDNYFKYFSGFPCPKETKIKEKLALGLGQSQIRSKVCNRCPQLKQCGWPKQYSRALDEDKNIIIMQHAHLGTPEVVYSLADKNFDAVFIDESFIDECIKILEPTRHEIQTLKIFDKIDWCIDLVTWLTAGGHPKSRINPDEKDLAIVKAMHGNKHTWRIPEFVRAYNFKRYNNLQTGIEIVNTIPEAPIIGFLDGTPPVRLLERMTGIDDIKLYGLDEIIDIKAVHPNNEIIQVIDSSISKTFLEADDRFYEAMSKIGWMALNPYKHKKILITVFKGWEDKAIRYFNSHPEYEGVLEFVTFNNMTKGTNKYVDFDVQFLLAGVYYSGNDYYLQAYKDKTAYNFHQRRKGLKEISNVFPYEAKVKERQISVARQAERNLTLIEYDENGKGVEVEYSVPVYPPQDDWFEDRFLFNNGNFQQSNRLRMNTARGRHLYLLGNKETKLPITQAITWSNFVNSYIPRTL